MTTSSILNPLIEPLRERRERARSASGRVPANMTCGHCSARDTAWPVSLRAGEAPLICVQCGGWLGANGTSISVCETCSFPTGLSGHGAGSCFAAHGALDRLCGSSADREAIADRSAVALSELYAACDSEGLDAYLLGVIERVGLDHPGRVTFIDLGEPAVAMLPGDHLVVSLGLLAALEDEAQLAFVLAREVSLDRAGWVWRRFGSAWRRGPSWLLRLAGRGQRRMHHAIELSLQVGYGPQAERAADREGLSSLIHADYEPTSAVRALRLLESAALAGAGGRFLLAADRAGWLEEGASALGHAPGARLNREVYRRAVDGFSVFAR